MELLRTTQTITLTKDVEFRRIFDDFYVSLCLFANQYIEDEAAAADIVQECFIKLWQLRADFFYLHQVKSFLYTSVRNKALNELEHSKIVNEYVQKITEKSTEQFFHDHVVEEEVYRILAEAIDKLPDQMKAIMNLALEGIPNKEIAETLNVSIETVHSLKKIAYRKLRVYLKEYYYFAFFLFI